MSNLEGSNLEWSSIRETLDGRFRSRRLARKFMDRAAQSRLLVDLGCGNGTNLRYLRGVRDTPVPYLGIDVDPAVLEVASKHHKSRLVRFERADLSKDLSSVPFRQETSITASAFLDITSKDWLRRFAAHIRDSPTLIAMTVAAGPIWHPVHDLDQEVGACLKAHRASDQGFGPAAGADASCFLADELVTLGCEVFLETSDWQLNGQDSAVIETLTAGVVRRCKATMPSGQIGTWAQKRLEQNRRKSLQLAIPHRDLLSVRP